MLRGLADYRILRCLAKGAQGVTYLALDTRLQRRVCIKVYHLYGSLAQQRSAAVEAWKLAKLDSQSTLRVYDVVAHGAQLALVMNYEPGCDLETLLESNNVLTPGSAFAIVSDVATGLAALRRARLVHADLKAANILVNTRGRAIIADFGTVVSSGQRPPGFSLDALSPEQARGDVVDLRSDFFALGLLLYRMLYGAHPFCRDGAVNTSALQRGLRFAPEPVADIDPETAQAVASLLTRLLAARPEDRPQTTFALREELREVRKRLPPPAALGRAAVLAARASVPPDASLRLPRRLVRLPLRRYLQAWFGGYWVRGSHGARLLLCTVCLMPLVLAYLLASSPGPCVAVGLPSVLGVAPGHLPTMSELRRDLTDMLRANAPDATILGLGPASDSRLTLSAKGVQEVCVAQRQLTLRLDCSRGRCALGLTARQPLGVRRDELVVPLSMGVRYLEEGLAQLVERQAVFLLR